MLILYKVLLGPLLLLQARKARSVAVRLPEAAGRRVGSVGATSHSARALRVLFFGDSSAAGVGVEHQHDAMAAQAAAMLCERIGMPVQWQLLARSGIDTRQALQLLDAQELAPADVLVAALGVNDVTAQRAPRQFLDNYRAIVQRIAQRTDAKYAVINGLPPMHAFPALPQPLRWYLGACAQRLDRTLQRWVDSDASLAYVSLQWGAAAQMSRDGYHPGAPQYRHWAQLVAECTSELLARSSAPDSSESERICVDTIELASTCAAPSE